MKKIAFLITCTFLLLMKNALAEINANELKFTSTGCTASALATCGAVPNSSPTPTAVVNVTRPDWCAAATLTAVEKIICNNPELSALDTEMNQLYAAKRAEPSQVEAQRSFLQKRAIQSLESNLVRIYKERINELKGESPSFTVDTVETKSVQVTDVVKPAWCDSAKTDSEKRFCDLANAEITQLDVELNQAYKQAMKSLRTEKKNEMRRLQNEWLKNIRPLAQTNLELANLYQQRILELKQHTSR